MLAIQTTSLRLIHHSKSGISHESQKEHPH
jgi:hypothetical protein